MFSIIPKEMRLKKLESKAIISNKKLFQKLSGIAINPEYGKGGTADFTSRELDKLVEAVEVGQSEYYQNLKETQMPLDTDTSAPDPDPDSSES